jgi:hypothetical protein
VIPFPEPVKRWVRVILIVFIVLILIGYLLDLAGHPVISFSR